MASPLERWKGINGRESDGAGWDWGNKRLRVEIGGCSGEGLTPFWCTFAVGLTPGCQIERGTHVCCGAVGRRGGWMGMLGIAKGFGESWFDPQRWGGVGRGETLRWDPVGGQMQGLSRGREGLDVSTSI